jgi:hypothetical protein
LVNLMGKGYRDFVGTYVTDTGEIRFGRILLIENDSLWDPDNFEEIILAKPGQRLKLAKRIAKFWWRVQQEAMNLIEQAQDPNVRVYRIDENGVEDVTDKGFEDPENQESPLADED